MYKHVHVYIKYIYYVYKYGRQLVRYQFSLLFLPITKKIVLFIIIYLLEYGECIRVLRMHIFFCFYDGSIITVWIVITCVVCGELFWPAYCLNTSMRVKIGSNLCSLTTSSLGGFNMKKKTTIYTYNIIVVIRKRTAALNLRYSFTAGVEWFSSRFE